ncbi:MAG: hypothetical protein JW810_02685 [Sedimentisphaerales bacterium]|nr:hypothetical protein [Sedimentisphaerales bacterium]
MSTQSNATSNKHRYVSGILLAAALILLGLTAAQLIGYMSEGGADEAAPADARAPDSPVHQAADKALAHWQETADTLQKKNLFLPPPAPPKRPEICEAILGDQAYIDGDWRKVGDTLSAGAKLIAIEATYAQIEHEGKTYQLAPIAAASSAPSGPAGPKPPADRDSAGPAKPAPADQGKGKPPAAASSAASADDPFAWLGVELSPELREKLEKMWAMLPDEQKEMAKQKWMNMSDEEKEKALEELENMPDIPDMRRR